MCVCVCVYVCVCVCVCVLSFLYRAYTSLSTSLETHIETKPHDALNQPSPPPGSNPLGGNECKKKKARGTTVHTCKRPRSRTHTRKAHLGVCVTKLDGDVSSQLALEADCLHA